MAVTASPVSGPYIIRRHAGGKYGVWDVLENDWALSYPTMQTINLVSARSARVVANTLNARYARVNGHRAA